MSGIIGEIGSKSRIIGINIGDSCTAYPTTGQLNVTGTVYMSPWAFMNNDGSQTKLVNPKLYSLATYGVTISVTGTYSVSMSCFAEDASENAYRQTFLMHSQTTMPTFNNESFYITDDTGSAADSDRKTQSGTKVLPLTGGYTYGMRCDVQGGQRDIPTAALTCLAFTLLSFGGSGFDT